MDIRMLRPSDCDSLTTLAQRSLPFDELSRAYLYERIWSDPDTKEDLLLGAWEGDTLIAFMIGVVRAGKEGPVGFIKLCATHPDRRQQGIATGLLTCMEDRLEVQGVRHVWVSGCAPWYVFAGVDVRYTPALLFLQKAGYTHVSDAVNMLVNLHHLPNVPDQILRRPMQHGITLRRMQSEDAGAFASWVKRTWNTNWAVEGLMALQNDPVSAFLAFKEDTIIGFAAYDGTRPGWFGPMGTEASLRNCGIGSALYWLCLEDMRRKGYSHAEISWAGPTGFYSKLSGAYIHRVFRRFKKELGQPVSS